MQFINNKPQLKKIRQKLRNNMPKSEKVFWQKIRGKQLGVKFRRQFSVENFILDFYSPEIKLGIEIDGDSHFISNANILKDCNRDNVLFKKYSIKILRFTNTEVKENLEGCLEKLLREIGNIRFSENTPSNSP